MPPTPTPPAPPVSESQTERLTRFVSDNRQTLLLALGLTTVIAGGGYYWYSSSSSSNRDGADGHSDGGKRKRKKKKSKDASGGGAGGTEKGDKKQVEISDEQDEFAELLNLSGAAIAALSTDERHTKANELKSAGNKAYSNKKFKRAITLYSKAIEYEEQAVFYSNRAACYTNMGETKNVIDDTTSALRLDPKYVMALSRRASAKEALGGEDELFDALSDFTAAAIIDGFKTEATSQSVDRVMRKFAAEKAQRLMKDREKRLPSPVFVYAYLEAFRKRPPPPIDESKQGDQTFKLALEATEAADYNHAFTYFHEAIEQGVSTPELHSRALNMRATFKFIMTDAQSALEDLQKAVELDPHDTQNYIKRASVHMELGTPDAAFEDFKAAEAINPDDPDISYHRGQVHFIMGEFPAAREQYLRSIELDSAFVFSHIQRNVSEYKEGNIAKAKALFDRTIRDFPDSGEVHNYYGEILLDQKEFEGSAAEFDKAIALVKGLRPQNSLPMINKALCVFQWQADFAAAEKLCKDALDIDPACDVGVATLAQLLLQQNKVYEAVEAFKKSADMARNEGDLTNALTYEAATRAQIRFIENYPGDAALLGMVPGGPTA